MDDTYAPFPCPSDASPITPYFAFLDAKHPRLLMYGACAVCKRAGRSTLVVAQTTLDLSVYFHAHRQGLPWIQTDLEEK